MIEIRRILCPIDFSDCSRRALDHAYAIARRYESTVTVVHVFSPSPILVGAGSVVFEPVVLNPVDRDQLLAATRAFASAEAAPGVKLEAVLAEGNTAVEILSVADTVKADLVVMGTHGRSGLERFVLGSIAERVVRKAVCPVMTVSQSLPDAVPATAALYKRILCPVDFSESSMLALKHAIAMAQKAGAQLTVLHVISHELEIDGSIAAFSSDAGMTMAQFLVERESEVKRRLQEATAGAGESCSVDTVLVHGKPWREALRIAAERDADLIVMGVQGRSPGDVLLFGSTAQHLVRQAPCPVLTLRHG